MDRTKTLLNVTLAEARAGIVGDVHQAPAVARSLTVQATFAREAGGTSCKAWIQTSFDGGQSWVDVMCFAFLTTPAKAINSVRLDIAVGPNYTPTDGTLADNTIKDGLLGDRIRAKYTTVGTYSGASSLALTAVFN
jgi:hypothetical protein